MITSEKQQIITKVIERLTLRGDIEGLSKYGRLLTDQLEERHHKMVCTLISGAISMCSVSMVINNYRNLAREVSSL